MIKMNKYIALVAAMLLGGASQAAYLYWQVDAGDASDITFGCARVVAESGGSSQILSITDGVGETKVGYELVAQGVGAAINLDQLSNASAYSFYIELINYNDSTKSYDFAAKSEAVAYSTLVAGKFIDVGDTFQIPQANVWHGSSYTVTPEPTSAMLVMLGVGLLVLKRKKA